MKELIFLDLEASSLSWDSYPIEIAWGSSLNNIKKYLISPESIEQWTDWNDDAEKLHGINRETLIKNGITPIRVCKKLTQSIRLKEIYSDNPCWDAMWLYKLYNAANLPIPKLDIKHVDELLINIHCSDLKYRVEGLYNCLKLKNKARGIVKAQHRAEVDVEYLITLYQLAKQNLNNEFSEKKEAHNE